jgi:Cytosol aminopeptidase family, N-terminal domain
MKPVNHIASVMLIVSGFAHMALAADTEQVKEKSSSAPNGVTIKVRMEGPYTADVPLQIVCYFKYMPAGAKRMTGAPVELDKRLGGVIAALRQRGEFAGDELETLLITPPKNSIKAARLLLIGLGPEENLSAKVLERVGRAALREAARLGVQQVGFAPLIRDQGSTKLPAGDVELAVVKAMLLAYDTDRRMQKQGLAPAYALNEWIVEAGPAYFDETVEATTAAIKAAESAIAQRLSASYGTPN